MEEMLIGTYIRQKRQEKGWTLEKLSEGVCDPATLCRIETNERPPSIRVAKALLQKMGLSSAPYLALLGKADILAERLQKEIRDDKISYRRASEEERPQIRAQILKKLDKLERLGGDDNRFVQQFILSTKATIGGPEGPYSYGRRLDLLMEAIRLTIPEFKLSRISRFRYSVEEVMIVNQIAQVYKKAGNRKEAIGILSQLLRYLDRNSRELDKYPRQFCLVAHNCAIYFGLEKEFEKATQLAQKGWDTCIETGEYQFLPGFIAILAECNYFQGNLDRSAELYVQAYNLYKALKDEINMAIMQKEMKERLGMEPPYSVW